MAKFYCGWPYKARSDIYRTIWEQQFKDVPLSRLNSLDEVAAMIRPGAYRPDSWRSLFDSVGYPGKAQLVFEGKLEPSEDFDCDDFAVWVTAVLTEGQKRMGIFDVTQTSVFWGMSGHVVCSFVKEGAWHYMDYGPSVGPFASLADLAAYVAKTSGKGAKPLIAARHDTSLRLIDTLTFA